MSQYPTADRFDRARHATVGRQDLPIQLAYDRPARNRRRLTPYCPRIQRDRGGDGTEQASGGEINDLVRQAHLTQGLWRRSRHMIQARVCDVSTSEGSLS